MTKETRYEGLLAQGSTQLFLNLDCESAFTFCFTFYAYMSPFNPKKTFYTKLLKVRNKSNIME